MSNLKQKPKVLFILGPTGVGKTSLSISVAKEFNGEIISVDSVQVFKEFDIGSAKVTKEEMEGITHHGIDILSPAEEFSASGFSIYTKSKIQEISNKSKLPIVVGGTAMYVKSLVEGYNFGGTEKHEDFRKKVEEEIEEFGLDFVFEKLVKRSPDIAKSVDRKNKVRVIRAFEILEFGDRKEKSGEVDFEYKIYALTMPREKLYERINARTKIMIKNGLVKEARDLYHKYGQCQAMRAIGYKEVIPYLTGEISEERMEELISQHTRNYAKRQLTFLKGMDYVKFVDVDDKDNINKMKEEIEKWLK